MLARPQTAKNPRAGRIVASIPDDTVVRQRSITPQPISVSDPVYWGDVLNTLDNGRLRVQLLGGSFLNIGVRSSMQVIQHDPRTEQSQIELSFGHLRGVIRTLTKPGASFEILTPTSVIDVVGTIFDIDATRETTRVRVTKGKVNVRSRNPKVKGEQAVNEGEETRVDKGNPPEKSMTFAEAMKKKREEQEKKRQEQNEKNKSRKRKRGN